MNDLQIPERPKGREDVVFRQLDEEWVLFDPATDKLHVLNLTAALVWSHCTGEFDIRTIAEAVAQSFDPAVDAERIGTDVEAALRTLHSEGLLA